MGKGRDKALDHLVTAGMDPEKAAELVDRHVRNLTGMDRSRATPWIGWGLIAWGVTLPLPGLALGFASLAPIIGGAVFTIAGIATLVGYRIGRHKI